MPRHVPDNCRLLFGPYRQPRLRVGARTTCLYRDTTVVITSWTDARISWPRCRALNGPQGGSGLLVDEELGRAVRSESASAVRFWWGVGSKAIWNWRRALSVGQWDTEGSGRLLQANSEKGAGGLRGKPLTPEYVERRKRAGWFNKARGNGTNPYVIVALEAVGAPGQASPEVVAVRCNRNDRLPYLREAGQEGGVHRADG